MKCTNDEPVETMLPPSLDSGGKSEDSEQLASSPERFISTVTCAATLGLKPSRMIQTGLIPNAHGDLVTDASYDFYGLRLATCSLDQR